MPSHLKALGLLSQLVAISIIIPAPLLLLVGPFFLWMLSVVFLGWRWTIHYVAIDAVIDLPQFISQQNLTVVAAAAPAAVASSASAAVKAGNPYALFLFDNPVVVLGVSVALLVLEYFLVKYLFVQAWRNAKRIRARVPWS